MSRPGAHSPAGRVLLRPWAEGDVRALTRLREDVALQAQLMSRPKPNDARAWLQRRSADPQGCFFVIADPGTGECLGFVQLTEMADRAAYAGICVAPEHQGRGLGAAALTLIERHASRCGVERVRLKVLPSNGRAIALYERLGYRRVPSGADTCLMEKAA